MRRRTNVLKSVLAVLPVLVLACVSQNEADPMDDEAEINQQVLESMREDGVDLTRPRDIDFHLSMPSNDAGMEVARAVNALGFQTKLSKDEATSTWTVECTRKMVPYEPEITKTERILDELAKPYGGFIDGWGSMVDPQNPNPR